MNYQGLKGILATEPNIDERGVWVRVGDNLYHVTSVERESPLDGDGIWLNTDHEDPQLFIDTSRDAPTRIRTTSPKSKAIELLTQQGIFDAKLQGIALKLYQVDDDVWKARIEELDWDFRGSKQSCCRHALGTMLQAFADHILYGLHPELKGRIPSLSVEINKQ